MATVKVTAGSSAINGWTVTLTLPSGATVTNAWNAQRSGTTGTVLRQRHLQRPGHRRQSTEFGFQGTGTAGGLSPTCSAR